MSVIFKLLMKFIVAITNFFLLPVNQLVANVFPSFTDKIAQFNAFLGRVITPSLAWFFNLLPPNCQNFVLFYLSMLLIFYTITLSFHAVIKVIEIIKNVKIW